MMRIMKMKMEMEKTKVIKIMNLINDIFLILHHQMIGILLASIVAVLAQDDESEFTSLTSTYNEETALRYWFFSCASYCS